MPSPSPSRPQLAIYAALAIAVLLIGARFLRHGDGGAPGGGAAPAFATTTSSAGAPDGLAAGGGTATGTSSAAAGAAGPQLVVDVKGAVRHPGVYRLAAGARTYDAVRRAGGLTGRADRIGVNLAARVVDGGEVVVPVRGAGGSGAAAGTTTTASSGGGAGSAGPLSLDLDSASEQQLEQLDGVGPELAAKIVAYRQQHGGISSVDDLDNVSGIGPAKLAAIRAQLGR